MELDNRKVVSIIVTFNRKEKLRMAVNALLEQTYPVHKIYIIDNASTDGTFAYIEDILKQHSHIVYVKMPKNIGGSGGFCKGFEEALISKEKPNYFWVCDDDAWASKDALKNLLKSEKYLPQPSAFFSRIIIKGTVPYDLHIGSYQMLCGHKAVKLATFASFLVPYEIVKKIGVPRGDLFILGDDTEYSMRINKAGYKIFYIEDSIVYHPEQKVERKKINWLGKEKEIPIKADWRYYYGTRNALLITPYPYKLRILLSQIMGSIKILIFHSQVFPIYTRAMWHGIIGKTGKMEFK